MDVASRYDKQIQATKEFHRADKETRYAHYYKRSEASLAEKERWAIDLIKVALKRAKKPMLSSSFGIDSVVITYLAKKAMEELGRDISELQIIWSDTLNEFPEVRKFQKEITAAWNLNVQIIRPEKVLKKILDENGGVTPEYFNPKGSRKGNKKPLGEKCCHHLKHQPMRKALRTGKYDLQISGLRADESNTRKLNALGYGEFFYSVSEWKAYICKPILWWTLDDVWDYVKQENIPYSDLYKKNIILKYPKDHEIMVEENNYWLKSLGIDTQALYDGQLQKVDAIQSLALEKIGFKLYKARTGCMVCPIPVKHQYLKWLRLNYPKVYDTAVNKLGYGKALMELISDEMKEEIKYLMGIEVTVDNVDEFLQDIIEAKPCVFDFDKK